MGSFLSYQCVVVGLEGVEIRPFIPPQTVTVGFIQRNGRITRAAGRFMDLEARVLCQRGSAGKAGAE